MPKFDIRDINDLLAELKTIADYCFDSYTFKGWEASRRLEALIKEYQCEYSEEEYLTDLVR